MLVWTKYPDGIKYDWKIIEGNSIVKNNEQKMHTNMLKLLYSDSGEKEERGA
ncbi:MAG: hypothetical protein HYU67_05145 [Flavobacteriia bacterium]|nr:hypothetical protein [Flavobacteriia bacterium]